MDWAYSRHDLPAFPSWLKMEAWDCGQLVTTEQSVSLADPLAVPEVRAR